MSEIKNSKKLLVVSQGLFLFANCAVRAVLHPGFTGFAVALVVVVAVVVVAVEDE